jgi:hypothetical protein
VLYPLSYGRNMVRFTSVIDVSRTTELGPGYRGEGTDDEPLKPEFRAMRRSAGRRAVLRARRAAHRQAVPYANTGGSVGRTGAQVNREGGAEVNDTDFSKTATQ